MNVLGFGISITRKQVPTTLSTTDGRSRAWFRILESYSGAWQQNVEVELADVLTHPIVFACVSLIASDIAKMRLRLVRFLERDEVWEEVDSPAFSPVLRKPNRFQNRIDFIKSWLFSKLVHGNSYILKVRDNRRVVTALYVLDPTRVTVVVAPDGSVFYKLCRDDLSQVHEDDVYVPESEIIHDKMYAIYHPLVGLSPIHACGLAAILGVKIQTNSTLLFQNGGKPGGVLTAPGHIPIETAERIKAYWDTNFTGENSGKVAVLGDGLAYAPVAFTAENSQLTEQWMKAAEAICSAFHVPGYKVGVGDPPSYNNIEALDRAYYSQCLQELIEQIELLLDEGLGLADGKINGVQLGTEFDLDDLLRMDTATLIESEKNAQFLKTVNEARKRLGLKRIDEGGDTVWRQQQDFSIEALNRRDEQLLPPESITPGATPRLPMPEDSAEAKSIAVKGALAPFAKQWGVEEEDRAA